MNPILPSACTNCCSQLCIVCHVTMSRYILKSKNTVAMANADHIQHRDQGFANKKKYNKNEQLAKKKLNLFAGGLFNTHFTSDDNWND